MDCRKFGEYYRELVSDAIKKLRSPINPFTNEFYKKLNGELDIGLYGFSDEQILGQSKKAKTLDLKKVKRCDDYKLPIFLIDSNEYSDKIESSRATAYSGGKVPFILLRDKENMATERNIIHEGGHIIYQLLTKIDIVPLDETLSKGDKDDFWMFKNELISKLLENAKPFGYTLNVLEGTPEKESEYVKISRIEINELFPDILEDAKGKGFIHEDFIFPVFQSGNFQELRKNIIKTSGYQHILNSAYAHHQGSNLLVQSV